MSSIPLEQQLILVLQTCALVGLSVRLWRIGMLRTYPYFFSYLLTALLQVVVLVPLPYYSMAYRNAWMITEGLVLCAQILVVLELSKVILLGLSGIASVARRYIKWTLIFAVVASLLLLGVERVPVSLTGYFLTCERAIVSSLVIFILLMMLFLVYYPLPLNRNVIAYSVGYAVYFLTKAAAVLVRNTEPRWGREISTVLVSISTLCLFFWLCTLSRRGEIKAIAVGHRWSQEKERVLLSHLETFNASLAQVLPALHRRAALPDKVD